MALTQESLLSFLLERGGKVTNSELLSNFRSRISGGGDPAEKQHNRELFKRLVNSIAVVKQTDGVKFVCVKKRYQDFLREFDVPPLEDSYSSHNSSFSYTSNDRAESDAILNSDIENNNYPSNINGTFLANGKHASEGRSPEKGLKSQDMNPTTVKVLNLTGDQSSRRKSGAVFAVIAVKSPPRDCAHSTQGESPTRAPQNNNPGKPFVLMTNVCAPPVPTTVSSVCKQADSKRWKDRLAGDAPPDGFPQQRPQCKAPRQGDDAKYLDSVPLEPLVHDWLVKCAAGRWRQIYSLLLQDTQLAQKKDFMSGFTVLHWAAKDGNHKVIRKILDASRRSGVHVDVNCKAHGGYTPLHIAAIHGHAEVMVLLVKSYGARIDERDNNGKKAFQYLGKGAPVEVRALLGGQRHDKSREKTEDEECRENTKGFNSISKLFQPHIGKKHKTTGKFAQDW